MTALVVGLAIIRSITAPLHQAVSIAHSVASDGLSQPIEAPGINETARLLQALAHAQQQLILVVNLSQRTESQAASPEQTSAACMI